MKYGRTTEAHKRGAFGNITMKLTCNIVMLLAAFNNVHDTPVMGFVNNLVQGRGSREKISRPVSLTATNTKQALSFPIIEGNSGKFRSTDARTALSVPEFCSLQGDRIKMEDILPHGDKDLSIVVLMRSWG